MRVSFFRQCVIVAVVVMTILSIGAFIAHSKQGFYVDFLDVGQGDATFITLPSGKRILIDCGPDRRVLAEVGRLLPWYDRSIDFLVITHPDSDHYAGCQGIVERYAVHAVIINGHDKDDAAWKELLRSFEERAIPLAAVTAPDVWEIDGYAFEILSPHPRFSGESADSNNSSIVFRLVDPERKPLVLFTGDAEAPLEQFLLTTYCNTDPATSVTSTVKQFSCPKLSAPILKVGHHGSDTSSSEDFIAAVAPREAIISAGEQNRFGHPSRRVLRRLERAGIPVWRTDEAGSFRFDGKGIFNHY